MVWNMGTLAGCSMDSHQRRNHITCHVHRTDIIVIGLFWHKMIKKKQKDVFDFEEFFMEELLDESEEDNVYAASW